MANSPTGVAYIRDSLVASTTVCPGFRVPFRSAVLMIDSANPSLTEPAGLKNSALT